MAKMYRALNTNVIVKDLKESDYLVKSDGGIIIDTIATKDMSRSEGILEDIGENCFEDFGGTRPKVGDTVVYARYAGKELGVFGDGNPRRIMRDLDILCIVSQE